MTLSEYPSPTVVSTTTGGANSFMTPSMSRNRDDSPLRARPTQSVAFETGTIDSSGPMKSSAACDGFAWARA